LADAGLKGFAPQTFCIPQHFCYCHQMNRCVVEQGVQMGVSISYAVHSHSMDRWVLSEADVKDPCEGVLETVWLLCNEAQQVGCLRRWEDCLLVLDASIQSQLARCHWWQVSEAGMSTAAPARSAVGYSAVEWNRSKVAVRCSLLQHPNRSQLAASRVQRMMSTFCEVTRGVGDTWVSCPTLLRGIWGRTKRAGFVVVVDFQLTFGFLVVEVKDYQHWFCNWALTLRSCGNSVA